MLRLRAEMNHEEPWALIKKIDAAMYPTCIVHDTVVHKLYHWIPVPPQFDKSLSGGREGILEILHKQNVDR